MKINFMRNLNVIFAGRYVKFWYAACFAIVLAMLANWKINESVSGFELTLYSSDGRVTSKQLVDKKQLDLVIAESPVTKSFKPVKW